MRGAVCLLLLAPLLPAQDEATLRRFFEGKRVRVKMDMPASHEGVDYHFGQDPPLDMRSYSTRVRRFGVALRNGDETMVTGVRLKNRNIEFQLGGGGYGVFGDDTGTVSARTVSKSSRERQLERDIAGETDAGRRSRMQSELNRLRDQRRREERRAREQAADLTAIRKSEVAQKRLTAGSRFNLWFPEGRLKESVPTPQEMMRMLEEWVDFGALSSR